MVDDEHASRRTRRGFLTTLGTAGIAALAGCSGGDGSTPTGDNEGLGRSTATESATVTPTGTPTRTATATTTPDSSYTVSMAPVGEVTFESIPERWESYFPGYVDMGVALGQADGLTAVGNAGRFYTRYYDELDGVSVNEDEVTQLIGDSGIDREIYLELDNDVHLTDPKWLTSNSFFGLEKSDVEQVAEEVGPFVGNTIFRRTDGWHDYRYYTMYEAFEKVAEVFQEVERYEAFRDFHDAFVAELQTDLPPARERPNGLLCYAASDEPESFSPYRISGKGTNKKPFHDLGITDALSGTGIEGLSESNRGKIDYETLLAVDPDALFVRGHETKTREEFRNTVLAFMREHNTASALTAVENGDVYRGGPIYLGPIGHLFVTERFATSLFPDTYSGDLFDRDELAGIVTG